MQETLRLSLITQACAARERAYARYSNFQVGAALLTDDGQVITGCNVENTSYGLTICAERAAVCAAIAAGCRNYKAIAIASLGGVSPCGACRQVLAEFSPDLPVLLIDVSNPGQIAETNLAQLLPDVFRL